VTTPLTQRLTTHPTQDWLRYGTTRSHWNRLAPRFVLIGTGATILSGHTAAVGDEGGVLFPTGGDSSLLRSTSAA
jgi:hypothetical protein